MAPIPKNILKFDTLFGNTDTRKSTLKELTAEYQRRLEAKIEDLEIDTKRIGKQALIIGGSITAVYLLLELLLPDDETESKTVIPPTNTPIIIERHPEKSSWVSKTVTSFAMTWALEVARQKLMEFLATQQQANEVKDTNQTNA
ncbi:MAG: hypothetical protein R2822_03035 [Spirosomataceae bacterium]